MRIKQTTSGYVVPIHRLLSGICQKVNLYWSLIKCPQTALLLFTGMAGYMTAHTQSNRIQELGVLLGSLFLAISGSTVLNMWYDRDIDARMYRTCWRPLPAGKKAPPEALRLGLVMAGTGIAWALWSDLLYGIIVSAGLFFDFVIYTVWLKRKTPWSIVWGGIAGGMPVLAGRVLAMGKLEWVGLLMAMSVLLWIPTHILTFSMRLYDDYLRADIPTFPAKYGFSTTRLVIAASSVMAAISMIGAAIGIGVSSGHIGALLSLSLGMLVLAVVSLVKPSKKLNFGLFKYASLYMLLAMLLMAVEIF